MVKNEIVLFESKDGKVALPVSVDFDTVWLSLLQMAELFDKDKSVIFRHVKNAIAEGEIDPDVTSAKFAMVTPHGAIPGKTRVQEIDCYNLDVIISVGYRVCLVMKRTVHSSRLSGRCINRSEDRIFIRLRRRRPRIFCILSRRITASRTAISALPPVSSCIFEAEQTAFAQGWFQAHG